jgi:phosphoribosylaminoimidazole carboxylase PurE protein
MPKVGIIMGSDSDLKVMKEAGDMLDNFGVEYEYKISSAHRVPEVTAAYAKQASERGIQVLIAGAGLAAHLPGVVAAFTTLPVIGVPIQSTALGGVDSLYSIVQMPKGIPVATVAINGSANAALLAVAILALANPDLAERLKGYRRSMAEEVIKKDQELQSVGAVSYLMYKEGRS